DCRSEQERGARQVPRLAQVRAPQPGARLHNSLLPLNSVADADRTLWAYAPAPRRRMDGTSPRTICMWSGAVWFMHQPRRGFLRLADNSPAPCWRAESLAHDIGALARSFYRTGGGAASSGSPRVSESRSN